MLSKFLISVYIRQQNNSYEPNKSKPILKMNCTWIQRNEDEFKHFLHIFSSSMFPEFDKIMEKMHDAYSCEHD